ADADHRQRGQTGRMAVMEPTKRGPFNRVLRTFRRQRGVVVAPDLPTSDAQRCVKVIEDLLAQRETNAQRAAAETLLNLYGGLDADGRRPVLELAAARLWEAFGVF